LNLYLDASVLVPTLVQEAASASVAGLLSRSDEGLIISELAAAEVSSAIGRLVRMSLLAESAGLGRLEAFDVWRMRDTERLDLQPPDFRLAANLVRRFELGLRAPDALHAAICQRAGLALVTLDARLARAASSLGIEVRVP
jgi:predicted nucleic acid-binding protein